MKKKIFILLFLFFLLPLYVCGLEYPKIDSKIVEIYDFTDDKILYEIDSKNKTSIASLTKIATIMVAIEDIDNLDEEVVITRNILKTVDYSLSVADLKAGDKVTYRDLLYASILPSGGDATNAIAILCSGSLENHVNKMNDLIKKIGLKNTHFVNVTGLDDNNHYSTADDVRKLLSYALNNDLFKKIYTTRDYTLTNGLKVKSTIYLYNPSNRLDTTPILGSKSGHTDEAGYCLSSLSNINGHQIMIINLKAKKNNLYYYNVVDSLDLIKFLNDNFKEQVLVNNNQLIKNIPVELSNIESYDIKANKDVKKYLQNDYDKNKVKIEYDGLEKISFYNKKGKKIGIIKYYFDDELLDSEDVIINTNIKINFSKILIKYYYILIFIFLFIVILIARKRKKKKTSS